MNPAQFRLLLAGPKVCRLHPFFVHRGYVCDGAASGEEALDFMRQAPRHVLLVELDLGDMLLADLLEVVRRENLAGAVILLDDPAKSGLIVATLTRGVDGYVATPPDELYLFRLVERQLLAQWALAQQAQPQADAADKQRLEKSLELERSKVKELVKEIGGLRDELSRAKQRPAPKPTAIPGFGPAPSPLDEELPAAAAAAELDDADGSSEVTFDPEADLDDDVDGDTGLSSMAGVSAEDVAAALEDDDLADDDLADDELAADILADHAGADAGDDEDAFDEATDVGPGIAKAAAVLASKNATIPTRRPSMSDVLEDARTAPSMRPAPAALADDARTSPRGYAPPPPPVLKPGAKLGFDDVPKTRPAHAPPMPERPTPAKPPAAKPGPAKPAPVGTIDDQSAHDLFVDVDDDADEETSEVPIGTEPRGKGRFLLTPDEE